MNRQSGSKSILLSKLIVSIAVCLLAVAIYFAFGFFFDVFAEASPILLAPLVIVPIFWRLTKNIGKKAVIVSVAVMTALTVAASTGVGVVATSKPAFGGKPVCGKIETYSYSRKFMKENYDINQKTKIDVWIPDGYSTENRYPVMYVLDGDTLFNYAAIKAAENSRSGKGDVIVVGIGYGYWNSAFARGGVVYQDTDNLRGRWRDFCFADDTQQGYMPGTVFGGESKRGKEYTDFIVNTVVKDVREKYCVDNDNSTIFGHSLGGGLAAYFLTQYDPIRGDDNPFNNFVIVDNGYLDYYNAHYPDLQKKMALNGNAAFGQMSVYRIWGGSVNPPDNIKQYELYTRIDNENWANVKNYFWIPNGANHSDTQTVGIDNALNMILGLDFGQQYTI